MVDFDARSYGAGDPDFTRRNLKNKYALLTAKTISWLFNPFYLPTVAVTLLMIFSYLNQSTSAIAWPSAALWCFSHGSSP